MVHFKEFIQPLHDAALITYCTRVYGFRCECMTVSLKIGLAGKVVVSVCVFVAYVCVFSHWLGCWLEIRPAVCLRAKETVCVSPSSLILTHPPPPPPLNHPTTHTHTHMQQGLTPSCTISMGKLWSYTHTTHTHPHSHGINPCVSISTADS